MGLGSAVTQDLHDMRLSGCLDLYWARLGATRSQMSQLPCVAVESCPQQQSPCSALSTAASPGPSFLDWIFSS